MAVGSPEFCASHLALDHRIHAPRQLVRRRTCGVVENELRAGRNLEGSLGAKLSSIRRLAGVGRNPAAGAAKLHGVIGIDDSKGISPVDLMTVSDLDIFI